MKTTSFQNAVVHFDLDAFFVSVERLHHPELRHRPLAIGGSSGRGVVASCSYEARHFGVRSAMPIRTALRLCPDLLVVRGDHERYAEHSGIVTEIIHEQAPLFEKASIDEFYIDASGMDRFVGTWQWCRELRERITRESGLPISMSLSANKTVSKIGTGQAKPNGAQLVPAGTEKQYIAPLSTRKLPGLGAQTYQKLSLMGVRDIRTLSQIPPPLLRREFGKHGKTLWEKANAIDLRPVVPYDARKSISTERTFQTDTIDVRRLRDELTAMVMKLAYQLRSTDKLASCISVKIRYADFNTFPRQKRIPYTANDRVLIEHAHRLFEKLYERRQLIRLVGVRLSGLERGNTQINLFEDTQEEIALLAAMDRIRNRFGPQAVARACTLRS